MASALVWIVVCIWLLNYQCCLAGGHRDQRNKRSSFSILSPTKGTPSHPHADCRPSPLTVNSGVAEQKCSSEHDSLLPAEHCIKKTLIKVDDAQPSPLNQQQSPIGNAICSIVATAPSRSSESSFDIIPSSTASLTDVQNVPKRFPKTNPHARNRSYSCKSTNLLARHNFASLRVDDSRSGSSASWPLQTLTSINDVQGIQVNSQIPGKLMVFGTRKGFTDLTSFLAPYVILEQPKTLEMVGFVICKSNLQFESFYHWKQLKFMDCEFEPDTFVNFEPKIPISLLRCYVHQNDYLLLTALQSQTKPIELSNIRCYQIQQ